MAVTACYSFNINKTSFLLWNIPYINCHILKQNMSKAKPMNFSLVNGSHTSVHRRSFSPVFNSRRRSIGQNTLNHVLNKNKQDRLYAIFLKSKIKFYRECTGIGLSSKFMDSLFEFFLQKERQSLLQNGM